MIISGAVPLLAAFVSADGAPEAAPFLRGRGDDDELHPRHAGPGAAEFRKFGTALAAAVSKATKEAEPPQLKAINYPTYWSTYAAPAAPASPAAPRHAAPASPVAPAAPASPGAPAAPAAPAASPSAPATMGDEHLIMFPVATQSSVVSGGVACRAIDGNTDGDYNNGSVTHTSEEENPWWKLDLRTTSLISAIKVYNRVDYGSDRIVGATVKILDADGNPVTGGTRTIEDVQDRYEFHFEGVRGRYVKISKQGQGIVSLAEVEVYGPTEGCPAAELNGMEHKLDAVVDTVQRIEELMLRLAPDGAEPEEPATEPEEPATEPEEPATEPATEPEEPATEPATPGTPSPPSDYQKLGFGEVACPEGLEIESESECRQAIEALGLGIKVGGNSWIGSRTTMPKGCTLREGNNEMIFNTGEGGSGRWDLAPVCKVSL